MIFQVSDLSPDNRRHRRTGH